MGTSKELPDEDELRLIEVYRESVSALEQLSAREVLHYIARAYAAAMPYRPTHEELIRAAGGIAIADARSSGAGALWRGYEV